MQCERASVRRALEARRHDRFALARQNLIAVMQPLRRLSPPASPAPVVRHGGDITITDSIAPTPLMNGRRRTTTRIAWVLVVVILTFLSFVATRHESTSTRSIPFLRRRLTVFGADDRHAVSNPSSSPYSAVGLLKWSADRNCTASIIGTKYALTAADCVLGTDGTRRPSTLPKPELVLAGGTTTAHVTKIHRQSEFWQQWTQETYSILELDLPVGDTVEKLLLPTASELDQTGGKTPVQMVGFDGDVSRSTKADLKFAKCTCFFPATFNGPQYMLHHNCDTTTSGSPGSVLLVRYSDVATYIIGIHTNTIGDDVPAAETDKLLPDAAYSDVVANRGVLAPFIEQHLQALLKNASSMESTPAGSSSRDTSGSMASSLRPVGQTPSSSSPSSTPPNNPSGGETSVTSSSSFSPVTAYTCIGLVAFAWICILFIVVRHCRRPT